MTDKSVVLVTGSLGLVGIAAVRKFTDLGFDVIGIDNDLRSKLFGAQASNAKKRPTLEATCPGYVHHDLDIRDAAAIDAAITARAAAKAARDFAEADRIRDELLAQGIQLSDGAEGTTWRRVEAAEANG